MKSRNVRTSGIATETIARAVVVPWSSRGRPVRPLHAEDADVGHATQGHEEAEERDQATTTYGSDWYAVIL
jgi:hypothetical protein